MNTSINHDVRVGVDSCLPSAVDALRQLQYMFGGLAKNVKYRDGFVEVGSTKGECRFFKLTELRVAANYLAERSLIGDKVYVHAGLIKADGEKVQRQRRGEPAGHSKGADVLCWPVLWGEADHKDLLYDRTLSNEARNVARLAAFESAARGIGSEWGMIYATGTVPSLRLQGLIRLSQPAGPQDPMFWAVLKTISARGSLDRAANNSSQLIRLRGKSLGSSLRT
jgi:hypothetical protein